MGNYSQCPDNQGKSSSSKSKSKSDDNKDQSGDKSKKKTKSCIEGYHLNRKATMCIPEKQTTLSELKSNSPENTNLTASSVKCLGLADCFEGTVTEVVDGDTLDVNNVRIRLALVNTPEVNELGYSEAKQFVESSCGVGTHAKVDEDDGQKGGSFGRMIALVYCGNSSISLNQALLDSSHGTVVQEFCGVSEFASNDWPVKYCSTNESPIELSTENTDDPNVTNPEVVIATEQTGDCDPSYPDFCIPSPPTRPGLW